MIKNSTNLNSLIFIFALAFLSGMSALAYETLWQRILTNVFGATSTSSIIVITAFFISISLGAAFFTKRKYISTIPWVVFAILEGLIALSVLPMLLISYFDFSLNTSGFSSAITALIKVGFSFIFVGIPGFFMGGTLIALVEGTKKYFNNSYVTLLYGVNTLGGALGIVIVSFYSIYKAGVRWSVVLFMAVSIFISISSLVFRWYLSKTKTANKTLAPQKIFNDKKSLPGWLLFISFISGAVILAYEIILLNAYAQVGQNSSWSFSLMLILVIVFLGLSSLSIAKIKVIKIEYLFYLLLIVAILLCLFPTFFFKITHGLKFVSTASGTISKYLLNLLFIGVCSAGSVLLFSGMVFPVCLKLSSRYSDESRGKSIGRLLSYNALGAACGVILVQFTLIPVFGLWYSSLILGFLPLFAAFIIYRQIKIYSHGKTATKFFKPVSGVLLIVVVLWITGFLKKLPQAYKTSSEKIVELKCDADGVVCVKKTKNNLLISHNNHYYLSSVKVISTNHLMGHIPLLLHRDVHSVAYIGFATGLTASAAAYHNFIDSITVLEINPLVVKLACKHFGEFTRQFHKDKRVSILVEDGVYYFAKTKEKYDVIVGDLFFPWCQGVSRLFSIDHFLKVKQSLNQGGVFCQWLPVWQLNSQAYNLIVKTFHKAFPNGGIAHLFRKKHNIVGLIGFKNSNLISKKVLLNIWNQNLERIDKNTYNLFKKDEFFSKMFVGSVKDYLFSLKNNNIPVNTIDRPVIEPLVIRHEPEVKE